MQKRLVSGIASLLLVSSAMAVATGAGAAPAAPAASAVPGWTDWLDGVRDLPDRVLARLPADQRADPQTQEEVGRLALSAVVAAAIDALASDPDHPAFIPQLNTYLTTGQPNADTNYRSARIAPGGRLSPARETRIDEPSAHRGSGTAAETDSRQRQSGRAATGA